MEIWLQNPDMSELIPENFLASKRRGGLLIYRLSLLSVSRKDSCLENDFTIIYPIFWINLEGALANSALLGESTTGSLIGIGLLESVFDVVEPTMYTASS